MQSTRISPLELQQAKTLLLTRMVLRESSEDEIAGLLLELSVLGLPVNEPALAAKRYAEMTAEQVQTAFKKRLRPDDFVQIVRGPQPK